MKNIKNQLIAFSLLLCFAVTIVPLNFSHEHTHGHSEKSHCDKDDLIHSDDACHFSLYHNVLTENHCEHKAHFTDFELDCELCKILNNQRVDYAILKQQKKQIQANFSKLVALNFEQLQQSFSVLVFNKASPYLGLKTVILK